MLWLLAALLASCVVRSGSRTLPSHALRDWATAELDARGELFLDARTAWAPFAVRDDRSSEEERALRAREALTALVRSGSYAESENSDPAQRGERAATRARRRRAVIGAVQTLGSAEAAAISPAMQLREALQAVRARAAARKEDALPLPAAVTADAISRNTRADAARSIAAALFAEIDGGEAPTPSLLEVGNVDHGAQLLSMFIEAQARGRELEAAGVASREIFACVVDQIMNMAPEVILQIIINLVRTPIVHLLSTTVAQMTPDLLVPSSGRVAASASLTGALPRAAPPALPCVCAGGDSSAYDPNEGITATFLEDVAKPQQLPHAPPPSSSSCTSQQCRAAEVLLAGMQAQIDDAVPYFGNPVAEAASASSPGSSSALGALVEVGGAVGRLIEAAPWCPCLAGHLGYAFAPVHEGSVGIGASAAGSASFDDAEEAALAQDAKVPFAAELRFASGGAVAGARTALAAESRAVLGVAAAANAQQAAAADAFARASAWTQSGSDVGAGAAPKGPIAGITMRVTESLTAALAAQALPRLHAEVAEALKARLMREATAAAHRAILERVMPTLTRELSQALVARTAASLARPLVLGAAARVTADTTPALALPLSLALVHALTHNPADDYFCAYCAAGGAPPAALNATLDVRKAPLEEQRAEQRVGAYCDACARAAARSRLTDDRVRELVQRHAPEAVQRSLADLPATVDAALREAEARARAEA